MKIAAISFASGAAVSLAGHWFAALLLAGLSAFAVHVYRQTRAL